MHLLALFRTILRESYSYIFFHIAIEESLLDAEDLKIESEKKALLLFFLNMAYVEVGGVALFDELIDKFGIGERAVVTTEKLTILFEPEQDSHYG